MADSTSETKAEASVMCDELAGAIVRAVQAANAASAAQKKGAGGASSSGKKSEGSKKALQLVDRLVRWYLPNASSGDKGAGVLAKMHDTEEQMETIVDFTDSMLDSVHAFLDEAPSAEVKIGHWVSEQHAGPDGRARPKGFARQLEDSALVKPQLRFSDEIDNSNTPFVHQKIKKLHPAKKGAEVTMENIPAGAEAHPLHREITTFAVKPEQMKKKEVTEALPLEETPCTWIDTPVLLSQLAATLDSCEEFALAVHNHSLRSFQGFSCLVLVSTRAADYLVDAIELRAHMSALAKPLSNPAVIKVMHGGAADLRCLQRDFGLYVVGLFDTGIAARTLGYGQHLSLMLHKCCQIDLGKHHAKADWRTRPLLAEMILHARNTIHHLLQVADVLHNELVDANSLKNVWELSQIATLGMYEKELLTDDSHRPLLAKTTHTFNPLQISLFAKLYQWRDAVARREDECTRYVLPDKCLFAIAQNMPTDRNALLACCKSPAPPLVAHFAQELCGIVLAALHGEGGGGAAGAAGGRTPQRSTTHVSKVASPVPTVDQLYQTVGWVDHDAGHDVHRQRPHVGAGVAAVAATGGVNFDDGDSDDSDASDASAMQRRNQAYAQLAKLDLQRSPVIAVVSARSAAAEPKPPVASRAGASPLGEAIPRSMTEIYALSNRNRKRNKERKKKKDDAADDDGDSDDDAGHDKRSRGQDPEGTPGSAPLTDASAFMAEVGWTSGRGGAGAAIEPFDYASAAAKGLAYLGGHSAPVVFDGSMQDQHKGPRGVNPRLRSGRSLAFKPQRGGLAQGPSGGGGGGGGQSVPYGAKGSGGRGDPRWAK